MREANSSKLFYLIRKKDPTGISGTGKVLDGVIFPTGQVVICWRKPDIKKNPYAHSSITIYNSFTDFEDIHIKSRPDESELVFVE